MPSAFPIIAALARKFLDDVVAVSFSYLSTEDGKAALGGTDPAGLESASDDFRSAAAVAEALDLSLMPVFRSSDAVPSAYRQATKLCQDWRDFNIHCAVVNLFLAQDIRAAFPSGDVIVLTGDLMNEFVCDYHEEIIDGVVYYPQPRASQTSRRRFFVRGLDAGDREIGVFNAFRLPVFQAYAWLAEHYMTVPDNILSRPDAKEFLNAHLLPAAVRGKVGKKKQRAQVGGVDGGTLGIIHRLGLDQGHLKQTWVDELPTRGRGDNPFDIIQFGRYRMTPKKD